MLTSNTGSFTLCSTHLCFSNQQFAGVNNGGGFLEDFWGPVVNSGFRIQNEWRSLRGLGVVDLQQYEVTDTRFSFLI